MADIEQRFTASQYGTRPCAECSRPQLVAEPWSTNLVRVTLREHDGVTAALGAFTPKQLGEFAEAAAAVLVKQSEVIRARAH